MRIGNSSIIRNILKYLQPASLCYIVRGLKSKHVLSLLNEILWLSRESWNIIESKVKLLKTALVWYCLFPNFNWVDTCHCCVLVFYSLGTTSRFFSCYVTCNTNSFVLNVFLGFIWTGKQKMSLSIPLWYQYREQCSEMQPGLFWKRIADVRLWRCWCTCASLSSEGVHQLDLCLHSLLISGGSGSIRGSGFELRYTHLT